jgi:hypothetical protein
MTRVRKVPSAVLGFLADRSGSALRSVPGLGGAALVSYGLFDAWHPLGFIAAGGFLLLIDRRVP